MADGEAEAELGEQEGRNAIEDPLNTGDSDASGDDAEAPGAPVGEALKEGGEEGAGEDAGISGFASDDETGEGQPELEEDGLSMVMTTFGMTTTGESESGSVSKVENTADDKDFSLGEDDEDPAAVLAAWEVSGSGKITVEVSGGANGTLTYTGGALTFTGTAAEVQAWLDGVRYQYKTDGQEQAGDTDTITLTFKTFTEEGVAKADVVHTQKILIAPQNDAPVVGKHGGSPPIFDGAQK